MAFHVTPRLVRSGWSLALLVGVIAVNEGLALAGYGRLAPMYADAALGLALVGVAGTLGRPIALAACTLVMLYLAATMAPVVPPDLADMRLPRLATLGVAFYGVVLLVDHFLRRLQRQQDTLEEAQALALVGSWEWDIARDRVTLSREGRRQFGLYPFSPSADDTVGTGQVCGVERQFRPERERVGVARGDDFASRPRSSR